MTVINYSEFNVLMTKYPTQLVVLGFPCPQFLNQEPGKNTEILNCLKYVRPGGGYVPHFMLTEKTMVNGDPTLMHPVYVFLKGVCPQPSPIIEETEYISWSPVTPNDITWNFEKFLMGKDGIPYKRYDPTTPPTALIKDIDFLLSQ